MNTPKFSPCTFIFILFLTTVINTITGQEAKEVGKNDYMEKMNQSFSKFKDSSSVAFKNFQEKEQQALQDFKKKIEQKWGAENFVMSDCVNWVEYSYDNDVRSTVNFKEGIATIEVLVDQKDADDNQKVEDKVSESIKDLALTNGTLKDFEEDKELLAMEPVLDQQLNTKDGKAVTEDNVDQFAQEIISEGQIEKTTVKGDDGNDRLLVSLSIPLAPDYLKVRAEKVLPTVTKYANKYDIEPELILSVIHVESYFNPKAISHANAIGLMQLVPSSGGSDSYKYVFGKDNQPSRRFLFNPDNNINLGTAYLKILMTEYLAEVVNGENRRHCTVASYNTGIGNVCQAISGNKIVSQTVTKVNQMTPQQTFNYLARNLKYKEAREYVVKVNGKYLMYKGWVEFE